VSFVREFRKSKDMLGLTLVYRTCTIEITLCPFSNHAIIYDISAHPGDWRVPSASEIPPGSGFRALRVMCRFRLMPESTPWTSQRESTLQIITGKKTCLSAHRSSKFMQRDEQFLEFIWSGLDFVSPQSSGVSDDDSQKW
jgi:hypothetical protein